MADRIFLDANVLFSAAYSAGSGLQQFWRLSGATLATSTYAVEEARRNLTQPEQLERLDVLLANLQVVTAWGHMSPPADVRLPEKDIPILQAVVAAGATHLVTGDTRAFGLYFGRTISGVAVDRPAAYLRSRGQ